MKKTNKWTAALLLLVSLPAGAQMTLAQEKAHIMATETDNYSEFAALKAHPVVIIIPPDTATTVNDSGSERDLVGAFVRLNLTFTGRYSWWRPDNMWFEFEDVGTKTRYRFFKDDTITALFVDLSSVKFSFIGTAFDCPSGQCFAWLDGSETRPVILPDQPRMDRRPDRRSDRQDHHPGRGRQAHGGSAVASYSFTPMSMAFYDPYDSANWQTPGRNW